MITRLLVTLIFVLLISSCGGPPPYEEELWTQEGKTRLDVERTILECGLRLRANASGLTENGLATYDLCMIGAGYTFKRKYGKTRTICDSQPDLNLPACRPGAPVPRRDPNRRINSDFCKSRKTSALCLP